MGATQFTHPRRLLLGWAAFWAVGLAIAIAYQFGMFRYTSYLRENSPWTYLRAAEEREAQNDWLGAVAMLEEAAKRDPASPLPYERAGLLYYERGNLWEKALESYRNAINRGSDSLDVRGKVIWCLIHMKKFRAAAEFGESCIKEGSDSAYFPRYIAEAYRRAGDDKAAIPFLEKAIEGFPNDLYLMDRLAQSYKAIGEQSKADAMKARIDAIEGH